jgi:hypothetical protein
MVIKVGVTATTEAPGPTGFSLSEKQEESYLSFAKPQ